MPFRRKLLLLLASIRFANLPSVVSNVWLGVALGVWFDGTWLPEHLWLTAALVTLAGAALYVSGNFLNDWHDRQWDAEHRPERALPQGIFPPGLYLGLAIGCAVLGVVLAGFASLPSGMIAVLIVLCIVGYTRWHKQGEWTILLMGLCRGLLPMLFATICLWQEACARGDAQGGLIFIALQEGFGGQVVGLTLYVIALSRSARRESLASHPDERFHPHVLVILAVIFMAGFPLRWLWPYSLLGLLPFGLWMLPCFTRYRRPIGKHVAALLAGLPLLDWVCLLPLALWLLNHQPPPPHNHAVALTSLLLPPLAFLAGRLLQRLTPAT